MRLAKTPLPRFFVWWGSQLLACLPETWRKRLAGRSDVLLLEHRGNEVVVWRERSGQAQEFGRIDLSLPAEAQAEEFRRLRARIDNPGVRSLVVLPETRALRRTLTLPAAAEDNLRQVLSFEMDRQTPFKADQVHFDSRVVARDTTARNLRVELVAVPRAQFDPELAAVGGGALELDGVDIWRGEPGHGRHHLNLLPAERRARRRDLRLPLNLALAAAALVLLVFNMSLSLKNRAIAVEKMREEVAKVEVEARRVLELRKALQDSVGGANFLSEKKRKGPVVIGLLDDVSRRLSDDTYLERLSIENNQIQLQGQSKEAAGLISVLAASPYLSNPRFEGQIQPDPRTGKDRFTISAEPREVAPGEAGPMASDAQPGPAPSVDAEARKEASHGDA
ncbi:PilN domain-containing protein [Dokdonella sp.]|uniref:PilN domain-containing protein n=1 Tax=Dokdonella sp. TaxID=2291710 RepID=UPI0025BCC05B|nr:PilN domain-containing protein [Dokdonella sp.]MBX3690808.1 PilN domain-containing protein [Dokdonella sp.]MCW5566605.1 PilN domain-containing protein [Dokdonella sp.]